MIETTKRQVYIFTEIKYEWTVSSFNERTGNECTSFRPNRHTAPEAR